MSRHLHFFLPTFLALSPAFREGMGNVKTDRNPEAVERQIKLLKIENGQLNKRQRKKLEAKKKNGTN